MAAFDLINKLVLKRFMAHHKPLGGLDLIFGLNPNDVPQISPFATP